MIAALLAAAIPVFAQLSLADAQARAAANDPAVAMALATVRVQQAALQSARIAAVPHLSAEYALAPQAGPLDNGTVEQHYVAVAAGMTLNDLIGSSISVRATAASLLAAQRDADAAELTARENAARLYFAALQSLAVEGARARSVAGARRDRAAADLRARSGEAPQIDVVRADVTLAQAQAELSRAQADRDDALDALSDATTTDVASLQSLRLPQTGVAADVDIPRVVDRALASRPELASLLAQVQAHQAEVVAARQLALPTTTIEAGYQRGVDTAIPVSGLQAGARIDVPLASDAGNRAGAAQAQVDAAVAQLAGERRKIVLEARSAARDVLASQSAVRAAEQARDEAARALDAVELGYREGASSSLDLADARRTDEQATVDALTAQYQLALALAVLQVIAP